MNMIGRTLDQRAAMFRDRLARLPYGDQGEMEHLCRCVHEAFKAAHEDGVRLGMKRAAALAKLTDEERALLEL